MVRGVVRRGALSSGIGKMEGEGGRVRLRMRKVGLGVRVRVGLRLRLRLGLEGTAAVQIGRVPTVGMPAPLVMLGWGTFRWRVVCLVPREHINDTAIVQSQYLPRLRHRDSAGTPVLVPYCPRFDILQHCAALLVLEEDQVPGASLTLKQL
jgi:hypothetical protein